MIKNNLKVLIKYGYDLSAIGFAWVLSYLVRFNFNIPVDYQHQLLMSLPFVIIFQLAIYFFAGLNKGIWKYSGLGDLIKIIKGAGLFLIVLVIINIGNIEGFFFPRSVLLIFPFFVIFFLGVVRFIYRLYMEESFFKYNKAGQKALLIIGAGPAALSLIKELRNNKFFFVAGILDSDKGIHGREVGNIKILGGLSFLDQAVKIYNIEQVIIAIESKYKNQIAEAINSTTKIKNLEILISPSVDQLPSNKSLSFSALRHVRIEDLLGRDVVDLKTKELHLNIFNTVIFISGAGGSIGSELCKQLIQFKPKAIICFDVSEFALYSLEQALHSYLNKTNIIFLIGDIRNSILMKKILSEHSPDFVFHAAAYKHVPLVENMNISEAFSNNVIGTYRLALACKKLKIKKFILISSDKAVNPSSIMGATKRLSEMVCQALNDSKHSQFVTVRFGNVLGSSGSVIPKFQSQIEAGGPITVTHREITRFFMALPEAALLVMQASVIANKGEIFVLDMGNPVKIVDLAKKMITLSGSSEDNIKIQFTGLRPGEKLYEEILISGENILKTSYNKIFVANTTSVSKEWLKLFTFHLRIF